MVTVHNNEIAFGHFEGQDKIQDTITQNNMLFFILHMPTVCIGNTMIKIPHP